MATDFLTLGGLVFDSWSTPHQIPFGGQQAVRVHKLPGGSRVTDVLGPDERDIVFSGMVYNNAAVAFSEAIDAMRISGAQVPLTFAGRFHLGIVKEVKINIERYPQLTGYDIVFLVTQNNMAGPLSAIPSTVSQLVSADLATALSIAGL
jgi:hypothetical protein